jgi:hypothetical protein
MKIGNMVMNLIKFSLSIPTVEKTNPIIITMCYFLSVNETYIFCVCFMFPIQVHVLPQQKYLLLSGIGVGVVVLR